MSNGDIAVALVVGIITRTIATVLIAGILGYAVSLAATEDAGYGVFFVTFVLVGIYNAAKLILAVQTARVMRRRP